MVGDATNVAEITRMSAGDPRPYDVRLGTRKHQEV